MKHLLNTALLFLLVGAGCDKRPGAMKPAHSCTICLSAAGIGGGLHGQPLSGSTCATEGASTLEAARDAAQLKACEDLEKDIAGQWHAREGINYENSFTQATINLCDGSGTITSKKTNVTSTNCK